MEHLGENPDTLTPILDKLLRDFVWPQPKIYVAMLHTHTERVKAQLSKKAERGYLTKADIEEGLSELAKYGGADGFQREVLEYLALNHRETFVGLSGGKSLYSR